MWVSFRLASTPDHLRGLGLDVCGQGADFLEEQLDSLRRSADFLPHSADSDLAPFAMKSFDNFCGLIFADGWLSSHGGLG